MKSLFKCWLASSVALTTLACPAWSGENMSQWKKEFTNENGRPTNVQNLVHLQPYPTSDIRRYLNTDSSSLYTPETQQRMIQALQKKVKYVFVIFNENRSFDNEYGTFPGVNGLYSDGLKPRSAANTPGYTQTYTDKLSGLTVTVNPFRIGPQQNATFTDSVDHSHTGLARKIDVVNGVAKMDQFAYDEYVAKAGSAPTTASNAKGTQFARLVMSHVDCETIPFFWYYASRFTIFDNIFATEDTPSTPNAIAMIAGQSGETQWVKHPDQAFHADQSSGGPSYTSVNAVCGIATGQTGKTAGVPVVNDRQPFNGSQFDATAAKSGSPAGCSDGYGMSNISTNQTYATVPLTALGKNAAKITSADLNPSADLADIRQDIPYLTWYANKQVGWRWYQNGYDLEPTDATTTASYANYVSHHNGAQYFGYITNNPKMSPNLKGLGDFFSDIANGKLPNGGVMYIRGGYHNVQQTNSTTPATFMTPPIQNPDWPAQGAFSASTSTGAANIAYVNAHKNGDDDHPSYTDHNISEAMAARVINAVASNEELWSQSAIVITYDESDGFYDHVPPRILSYGPDSLPLSRGVRVPLILISPYARAHSVSSAEGDHNAVIETVNAIFGLPPLASLPDEAQALAAGNSPAFNQYGPAGFQQKHLGPRDLPSSVTQSLLSGFDLDRLEGRKPILPASLAMIPASVVNTLPHMGGAGACKAIGITPEDVRQGITNVIPNGFNTLPSSFTSYN
jgi:phospholipase C